MVNLFITYMVLQVISENFTGGYKDIFLDAFSIIAILCGIFVIISKNPIMSLLFLIGLFLSISSYLILLGMNFIGLVYLLVYIGAVSILFLFILMLINIRISELLTETTNSIPLAIMIGISFYYSVYQILPYSSTVSNSNLLKDSLYNNSSNNITILINRFNNDMFYATSKSWDGSLGETTHITSISSVLYTSHFIWLLLTSMILLLAMVGAIIITSDQKKN